MCKGMPRVQGRRLGLVAAWHPLRSLLHAARSKRRAARADPLPAVPPRPIFQTAAFSTCKTF